MTDGLPEKVILIPVVRKFPAFMEPSGFSACLQNKESSPLVPILNRLNPLHTFFQDSQQI